MKIGSSLLVTSLLLTHSAASPAAPSPEPGRSITVHRSYILPEEPVRARIRGASSARVFRLAFYEPGCAGDEAWAARTVECYSVRREHRVPSSAWLEKMKRLVADTKTYSTQFERECSGAPEYVVRLVSGAEPVDAWICFACSQITLTVGPKMKARGGFDRSAGDLRSLMKEAVGEDGSAPEWAIEGNDFPLERGVLPVDEAPELQGMNPGIRILTGSSPLAHGERSAWFRIDPEGTRILVRVENGATGEERSDLESLARRLVFTPARRNGLPVSSWVKIAYEPESGSAPSTTSD